MAVDVERRQQTHQLLLVTAPTGTPAAQRLTAGRRHSGGSKCLCPRQQLTWRFPEVRLSGILLEKKSAGTHGEVEPVSVHSPQRAPKPEVQRRLLGGSSSPVRTALAEGSARSSAVRPSVFLMVGSAPCCSSATHTDDHMLKVKATTAEVWCWRGQVDGKVVGLAPPFCSPGSPASFHTINC